MDDVDYVSGRVSAAVFHEKSELREIGLDAIARFLSANALHADIFQSTRQMEAEIVAMTLKLFKGNDEACGVLTSGGTESLSMAVKAYRDLARTERGVTDPELVAPVSIHPAVAKACHLFAIRLVTIPVDRDMRADIRGISRAITKNTIAIFGSAPSWPHGAIDDFVALGRIARKHNTGLHVDSCLGGFVLPFMADAGYAVPPFDFTVPGVTSISADIHKYGLAPKGNSVLMYSSPSIRRHQFFTLVDYPGGLYASPSFAGTRPGMLIAGAWATMLRVGKAGYVEVTADIIRTARTIRDRVPGLVPEAGWKVLGDPVAHVVAFTATTVDPLAVLDEMGKKGWHLAALQNPNGVQVAVTSLTVPHVEQLLRDWEDATRKVLSEPAGKGRWASMYASVKSVPDTRIIDEIVEGYLGALYKPV